MAQRKQVTGKNVSTKKKAVPKKASVKKPPKKKSVQNTKRSVPKHPQAQATTLEKRHCLIAEAAYLIAEQRGFQGGAELDDWLRAEADVDARLSAGTQASDQR